MALGAARNIFLVEKYANMSPGGSVATAVASVTGCLLLYVYQINHYYYMSSKIEYMSTLISRTELIKILTDGY